MSPCTLEILTSQFYSQILMSFRLNSFFRMSQTLFVCFILLFYSSSLSMLYEIDSFYIYFMMPFFSYFFSLQFQSSSFLFWFFRASLSLRNFMYCVYSGKIRSFRQTISSQLIFIFCRRNQFTTSQLTPLLSSITSTPSSSINPLCMLFSRLSQLNPAYS